MEKEAFQFNDKKGVYFEKQMYGDPPKTSISIYGGDDEGCCTLEPDAIRRLTIALIRNSLKTTGIPEEPMLTSKQCRLLGNIGIELYGYSPMDLVAVFMTIMQDVEKHGGKNYFPQDPDSGE